MTRNQPVRINSAYMIFSRISASLLTHIAYANSRDANSRTPSRSPLAMKSQSAGLLESVLRAKTATLPQDGLKEVIPSFPLFLESRRSDWYEGERRLGTDVTGGASKPCRGVQLSFSAVTDQTQIHVTVGPGVATGMRTEQIDRPERHDLVERHQAFSDGVGVVAKARRKVLQQQLHRFDCSAGPAPAQASSRSQVLPDRESETRIHDQPTREGLYQHIVRASLCPQRIPLDKHQDTVRCGPTDRHCRVAGED